MSDNINMPAPAVTANLNTAQIINNVNKPMLQNESAMQDLKDTKTIGMTVSQGTATNVTISYT